MDTHNEQARELLLQLEEITRQPATIFYAVNAKGEMEVRVRYYLERGELLVPIDATFDGFLSSVASDEQRLSRTLVLLRDCIMRARKG